MSDQLSSTEFKKYSRSVRRMHPSFVHHLLLHTRYRIKSPTCFKRAVAAGENIAHVFCKDRELLESLARRHGVRVIKIEHPGTNRQHVDLCGQPLASLLNAATQEAL